MFGVEISSLSFRVYWRLWWSVKCDWCSHGMCLGQHTGMAMATLKCYYFLWFLGFSKFHKKTGEGISPWKQLFLIIRGFELRTRLVNLLRKDTLSSFPFQYLWTSSRTEPSLPESHGPHAPSLHCCLATEVLAPLARWEKDKWITKKTPTLQFLTPLWKGSKWALSLNAISKLQPEGIFVSRKELLVSTTFKIRDLTSS